MAETIITDLCVIGAGSGGLSIAAGAAQMGAKVVLIEKHKMGGDCLNYGCVPSKALIKAGHVAQTLREAGKFGIKSTEPEIDMAKVEAHVKDVIAGIAPNDSVERFEGFGCKVLQGAASFVDKKTVKVNDTIVKARYFIVSVGSHAFVPGIPGLDTVKYHTNENIFDVKEKIDHLLVIGGGPIGSEIAQSYRRLGARVSIVMHQQLMGRGETEMVEFVRNRFKKEGIALYEYTEIKKIEKSKTDIHAELHVKNGEQIELKCSHILVATGRVPAFEGLNLEKAGVKYNKRGIETDARLRSSNKRIFAAGDCAGGPQFTHIAGYHAGIIIRNILFKLPAKVDYRSLPWVTYTDPEYAHTGYNEADATIKFGKVNVVTWHFEENDRACAEREKDGMIKVITTKKGVVVGCSIVGWHAGELLAPWILAIQEKMKIGKVASIIIPYPTMSEISKRAAGQYFTKALFSNRTKRIVRFLLRL